MKNINSISFQETIRITLDSPTGEIVQCTNVLEIDANALSLL